MLNLRNWIRNEIARACVMISIAILIGSPAFANPDPTPDSNANIVFLRQDCGAVGSEMENCFESMSSLFDLTTGWVWNTRSPSPNAASPLFVDIGPGTFGRFTCNGSGHVTLRGSGRLGTTLESTTAGEAAADIANCEKLDFMELTVRTSVYDSSSAEKVGVDWAGGGSSNWSNVDLVGEGDGPVWAWRERGTAECTDLDFSTHYFYSSKIIARDATEYVGGGAFDASCSQSWVFGSEINASTDTGIVLYSLLLGDRGDMRIFGSPIISRTPGISYGAFLTGDSIFHMHGGNIAPSGTLAAIAIRAIENAFVHTVGSAMRPTIFGSYPSPVTHRLLGTVRVESPMTWGAGPDAPTADLDDPTTPYTLSQTGQDMFVETDCDGTGCSGSPATPQPHLMIYSENCSGTYGPWFDVVLNACRQ